MDRIRKIDTDIVYAYLFRLHSLDQVPGELYHSTKIAKSKLNAKYIPSQRIGNIKKHVGTPVYDTDMQSVVDKEW